jgi:DNA-3-methyladenine glycosylase II
MSYLKDQPNIKKGLLYLLENDPVFKNADIKLDDLGFPYYGGEFPSFIRIVCGQQVSTSAAKSIWEKVQNNVAPLTPDNLAAMDNDAFIGSGLSQQKISYIKNLAHSIIEGSLDINGLKDLSDQDIVNEITAIKGFGPWSAEIYLMFCLARDNIWPSGDLGIKDGVKIYYNLKERPSTEKTKKIGEKFSPYKTSAALLFWTLKNQK